MKMYEWKITDLGNGQYGNIWISHEDFTGFGGLEISGYRIWIDPDISPWSQPRELEDTSQEYQRIFNYWRKLGSPVIDRNTLNYDAPWFPWEAVGLAPITEGSYDL